MRRPLACTNWHRSVRYKGLCDVPWHARTGVVPFGRREKNPVPMSRPSSWARKCKWRHHHPVLLLCLFVAFAMPVGRAASPRTRGYTDTHRRLPGGTSFHRGALVNVPARCHRKFLNHIICLGAAPRGWAPTDSGQRRRRRGYVVSCPDWRGTTFQQPVLSLITYGPRLCSCSGLTAHQRRWRLIGD